MLIFTKKIVERNYLTVDFATLRESTILSIWAEVGEEAETDLAGCFRSLLLFWSPRLFWLRSGDKSFLLRLESD